MKGNDIFPSKYIASADLKGRPHLVTISHCEMEALGTDQRLVIYFEGKEKGLVCNKTNFGRIAYLYGDETDDWTGAKIVLAAELVEYKGKPTMGLRVRPPNGAGPKQADRITSGPPPKPAPAKQQIADEELQHDSGDDFGDSIPF